MTNEQIIEKIIQNGETGLFEIINNKFSQRIYSKCYDFVNNKEEAKDLTHYIFSKIFINLKKFNGRSKFSTWLYSLVYNHCINRCPVKKYETRILDSFEIPVFLEEFELEKPKKYINCEKLYYVLENLSPSDKSILQLKYYNNLAIDNIKVQLNISRSAVKMRIKRAKEQFLDVYNSKNFIDKNELLSAS